MTLSTAPGCAGPVPGHWNWSPDAELAVSRATWVALCARAMSEAGRDVEPEPARAVAQELAEDGRLRALDPERVGERMVAGR